MKKKKVIKVVLIIMIFVILLCLCWLFLAGKSYSKYRDEVNTSSAVKIAKPVFRVEGTEDIKINGIEDTVYNFKVKNYDNTGISQVAFNYFIEIINNSKADLELELIKNGQIVGLNQNKTDLMMLSRVTQQEDNYQLKIKYRNNPAITEDIEGNVQIKAEAVQAKKN